MRPGERPQPELCEVANCKRHATLKTLVKQQFMYLCTQHIHLMGDRYPTARKIGRLPCEIERDDAEYMRASLGALGDLIYDREKSFSEKVREIDSIAFGNQ